MVGHSLRQQKASSLLRCPCRPPGVPRTYHLKLAPSHPQLEGQAAAQADVLASVAERLDAAERDLRDVEQLVAALQTLSAKQFDLLTAVLRRQQQQQQQAVPTAVAQQQRAAAAGPAAQEQRAAAPTAQPGANLRQERGNAGQAQHVAGGGAAGTPPAPPSSMHAAAVDEWGRQVPRAPPEVQASIRPPSHAPEAPPAPEAGSQAVTTDRASVTADRASLPTQGPAGVTSRSPPAAELPAAGQPSHVAVVEVETVPHPPDPPALDGAAQTAAAAVARQGVQVFSKADSTTFKFD